VCSRSRSAGACLLLLSLAAGACSRSRPVAGKVAILPLENLSADPALDWAEVGFAEVLKAQLTGGPSIDPLVAPHLREAVAANAGAVLQGYFSVVGGKLRVEAALENMATHRTVKTISATGPLARGVLPLAADLARQLDAGARPFSTSSEAALREFVEGLRATTPRAAADSFERAVAADPGFGAAYVVWVQRLIGLGERARAQQGLDAARKQGARIPAVERAGLAALEAALQGDRASERNALIALSRVTPADASVYHGLGDMDVAARSFASAVQWYAKALEREPDNIVFLNQAGYAHVFARDLESAIKDFTRYRDLRPNEANPIDSLGDAYYYLGRFPQAAALYLAAYKKDESFLQGGELYKAAWARVMGGDLSGADALMNQYLEALRTRSDPLASYRQAQWEYLTGRRRQAFARMEALVRVPLAAAQLSIWMLESGQAADARRYALQVAPAAPVGVLCRFLSDPSVDPPNELARVYSLLFSRNFAGAAARLQVLYRQTPPMSPDQIRILLAWALVESGQASQAADLLVANPLPEPLREQPLLSLTFPRIFYLRGVVLEKQGRRAEAKAAYSLFLRYSGDVPQMFGDEQRARQALERL
jgi:tetratricopeptide (TPR) repeat protein